MENRAKYLVFIGVDGQWYFHLQANNNEIICQSQGYSTKAMALKGIRSIKTNALTDKILIEYKGEE